MAVTARAWLMVTSQVAGAGAGAGPASEGGAGVRGRGQGDRSVVVVGLAAVKAAVDAEGIAADRAGTGPVLADSQLIGVQGKGGGDRPGLGHGDGAGAAAGSRRRTSR